MKRIFTLIIATCFLNFYFIPPSRAQWTNAGDIYGGNVSSLAVIGSNLIAGTPIFGIFLSTDLGNSWNEKISNFTTFPNVYALAVSGKNVFAGTFGGLYLSTDGGLNWTLQTMGFPDTATVFGLAVIDTNIFAGTNSGGVLRSTNNGSSWTASGLASHVINVLTASGKNLFAGTSDSGVYRSTDNGASWIAVSTGLTNTDILSITAIGSKLVAGTSGGVYLSTDNGAIWSSPITGIGFRNVYALALIGTKLFAGTNNGGIYLSTDTGETWGGGILPGKETNTFTSFAHEDSTIFAAAYGVGILERQLSDFEISDVSTVPIASTLLITAYPNPSSQSTTITFSSASSGAAEVSIVNLLGATVARLFSGELGAGEHSFSWDVSGAMPGMYECVVRANGMIQRIPLAVVR